MSYRIAKQLKRESDSRGITFKITYEVQRADLVNFTLNYGADARWLTGENSYVTKCSYDAFPPNYIVYIEAVDSGFNWSSGSGANDIKVKETTTKSYDISAIQIDPKWFGIRRASREDTGIINGVKDETKHYNNIKGDPCVFNDFIFNNATISPSITTGSIISSESPFSNSASLALDTINDIADTQTNVTTYTVEYSTNQPINNLAYFQGVNGSFGPDMAPASTAAGSWKAISQNAREYIKDGTKYHRVTRKMVRAPLFGSTQLLWKSAYIGTWTW